LITPINLIVGAAMLFFGRRLFWVFVAGMGFVLGAFLAVELLEAREDWLVLAASVLFGVLGAMLALFAQKVAIGVGGFLAGGYVAHAIALRSVEPSWIWIAVAIGGVIGAVLLIALFDWALIALSSLAGAALVALNLPVEPPWPGLIFLGLFVVGIAVQASSYSGKLARSRPSSTESGAA
jgi:hypothetical protein